MSFPYAVPLMQRSVWPGLGKQAREWLKNWARERGDWCKKNFKGEWRFQMMKKHKPNSIGVEVKLYLLIDDDEDAVLYKMQWGESPLGPMMKARSK